MSRIHVLHENDAWVVPLRAAFENLGAPCEEWFLDTGLLDLTRPPPQGVFYNRMSASSQGAPRFSKAARSGTTQASFSCRTWMRDMAWPSVRGSA